MVRERESESSKVLKPGRAHDLEFLTTKYTKYTKKGGKRRGGLEGFAANWNF
jgi:hypothetical protein